MLQCPGRVLRQPLEPTEIEAVGIDAKDIARRARLDRVPAEEPAQLGDLPLHLGDCRHRRRARVERVGKPLDRYDAVRVQEEDRQGRALFRPAEPQGLFVDCDLERSEDPEITHRA